MQLKEDKKYYLLADKMYKRILYSFKKNNPEIDIKVIDKNEFLNRFSFSISNDAIPFLLKQEKYDYSSIKKIIRILKIADFKNKEEFKLLDDIYLQLNENNYIQFDKLSYLDKKDRIVLLFENEEDFELISFLKRNHFNYELISFPDLNISPNFNGINKPTIYNFDNKFLQYNYLFSDIRKKIIENDNIKNNILVLINDSSDIFYINYMSSIYKIDCKLTLQIPLISNEKVSEIVKQIFKERNFKLIDNNLDTNEFVVKLISLIKQYKLDELKNFDFAYSSLIEILNSESYNYNYSNKGISFTTELVILNTSPLVYITNYQFDSFYKEYDDSDFYTDTMLEKIQVNPSYIKTKIERKNKLNYILYNNIVFLSRPLVHLNDKIYDSQFNKEFNFKVIKPNKHNQEGIYTTSAFNLINSFYKDVEHYPVDEYYKNYDSSFSKIDDVFKKDTFNITEFESYFKCPYAYYLNNVMKLSEFQASKNIPALRGNLIHKIFEDIYTHNYDNFDKEYDMVFSKAKEEYIKQADTNYNEEQEVFLHFIYKWLKDIVIYIRRQKLNNNSNIVDEKAEQSIIFKYKNYNIKGRIDKIVYTQDSNNFTYYTLIDYKSGSSGSFDFTHVFLGGSLQLPLYQYAIESISDCQLNNSGNFIFGGFGIQHIYFTNKIPSDNTIYNFEAIKSKVIISGINLDDKAYLTSFDKSIYKEFKNDVKLKKGGDYLIRSNPFNIQKDIISDDYSYLQYQEDIKHSLDTLIDKINNGEYNIRPTKDGQNDKELCQFCPYINICYRKKKDIYDISNDILNHFNRGKDIVDEGDKYE